jgi:hypothetical protein
MRRDRATSTFEQAFDTLNAAGVKVCVLRDDPAELGTVEEIDVLIAPAQDALAISHLEKLGWKLLDTGVFIPGKRAMVILRQDALLKLDIHLALIDGPLIYMDWRWLIDRAAPFGTIWLPTREAWLLHVLLHVILGKSVLEEKYRCRINRVLEGPLDRDSMLHQADRYGLGPLIREVMADPVGKLSQPEQVSRYRRRARRRLLIRHPANAARWLMFGLAWSVGQWLGGRRGVFIAVLGPDGSGKSTFIEELQAYCRRLEIPTRSAYLGPWDRPILPTSEVIRIFGANPLDDIPGTSDDYPMNTRVSKLLKGLIKRYAYYFNCLIEMWARYARLVFPHLLLRRLVIGDRYVHDLAVGFRNVIVRNSPVIRSLVIWLQPRPDFLIVLQNDPR